LYNRQLHPDEKKWIKDNAAAYAKESGLTVDQAVSALAAQADRQVQNGSAGAWDQNASAFLSQAHGMLPADGSSGPATCSMQRRIKKRIRICMRGITQEAWD